MTRTELLERHDPEGMYAAIRAFPDHLQDGWQRGSIADVFQIDTASLNGIVVGGMGGSAIGGDLLRTYCESTSPLPMSVARSYELPAWVSERTLFIASSYSGGTEETLALLDQAEQRGAQILAITSGGEVLRRAQEGGYDSILIPGGLQPRAALGYSLGVLLRLGQRMGMMTLRAVDMDAVLAEARARVLVFAHAGENPATELAASLQHRLPVVYSGPGLLEAVNMRWRTQLHENAKVPAVGNVFPELDHNEIMGFESAPPEIAHRMSVLVLRDAEDHPQVQRRIDITREIVAPQIGAWKEVTTDGNSRLSRMLSVLQLGDWVSFWLAIQRGIDPTPVGSIQELKAILARP